MASITEEQKGVMRKGMGREQELTRGQQFGARGGRPSNYNRSWIK
jgi:hypothetical protein